MHANAASWLGMHCRNANDSTEAFAWIGKQKNAVLLLRSRKQKEIAFINYVLKEYHLSESLLSLAIIESDLDTKCLSTAGALGVWQLMPFDGTDYGLTVLAEKDERTDLYKSTYAAAKYLVRLCNKYNDLSLVVAAYNCGDAPVDRAIRKTGTKDFYYLQYFLPEETRKHVKKFCYVNYILNIEQDTANRKNEIEKTATPDSLVSCRITGAFTIKRIALALNMQEDELIKINPGIESVLQTTGSATLYLPIDKMPEFLLKRRELLYQIINE